MVYVRVHWAWCCVFYAHRRAQLGPTLCNPMACSPPGSSVHGIFPGKNTGVFAVSSSKGSSRPRGHTPLSPRLLCLLHWQADSFPLASIFYGFRQMYKLSATLWSWAPTRAFLPSVTHTNRTRPSLVQSKGRCPARIQRVGRFKPGLQGTHFPARLRAGRLLRHLSAGRGGAPEAQARLLRRRRTSTARAPAAPRQPSWIAVLCAAISLRAARCEQWSYTNMEGKKRLHFITRVCIFFLGIVSGLGWWGNDMYLLLGYHTEYFHCL